MRIGTVGIGRVGVDETITIIGGGDGSGGNDIVPGTPQSGGYTSGPAANGDTLMCPPGFPYDYGIHDCSGYAGSPGDVAELTLQAAMDVCTSGGRQWDMANNRCMNPVADGQIIPGIPNLAVYFVGGLLLLTALKKK